MTEAMKKVSSRIQEVSDEEAVVASFLSIEAAGKKRDVSSSAADC